MNYLRWHYITSTKFIIQLTGNYLFFVGHIFSVKVLLKTLFYPWRKITAHEEKHGIADFLDAISFDLISRILGLIVRLATILTSLLFFALVFVVGAFVFVLWLILPIFSLPIYFMIQKRGSDLSGKDKFVASHLEDISNKDNVEHVSDWFDRLKEEKKRKRMFWTKENLSKVPGIGRNWAYGYTILLDKLTYDLSRENLPLDRFVGRRQQIEELQRKLSKENNNNVLLVGEPGVGRKTITIGLAKLIYEGKSYDSLTSKRVLFLDVHQILSSNQSETEQNLTALLEEAKKAENIILVIPSIEEFVNPLKVDLSDIFYAHLQAGIQLIGITDPSSYQKYFLKNSKLLKIFEKVDVSEVSDEEALVVLENLAADLEKKYKIIVSYEALAETVKEVKDLITDIPFPEKAIDLLNEAFVFGKTQGKERLERKDIEAVLSEKTKLPLGELTNLEKVRLEDLEKILHQRVIGQDLAIEKISQSLRRKRTGVTVKTSPIGTFLFVGPTGVGKTETAKALAQVYFGDENRMIRLDMSEFQNESDIGKLIGDNNSLGILTSQARQNPFTVLLLDEFEKAGSKILNIFLTIFDEGYITDGVGKKVSFKNTVIIATSNAGSEFIREKVLAKVETGNLEKELLDYLLKEKVFSPELLNRFDAVVFYKPLSEAEISQVADLMIDKLSKKLRHEKGIALEISRETAKRLVEKGYDPVFGARNLQRVIQEEIEEKVAEKILKENLQKGARVTI